MLKKLIVLWLGVVLSVVVLAMVMPYMTRFQGVIAALVVAFILIVIQNKILNG